MPTPFVVMSMAIYSLLIKHEEFFSILQLMKCAGHSFIYTEVLIITDMWP